VRYGVWFLVGVTVYALYGFRHSRLREASEAAQPRS
jgi:hypothetical protein